MTVFNNKVIQHIPKTGGTAFKKAISKRLDMLEYNTNHKPLDYLGYLDNEKFSSYEVVAVLREPVNWYLSWYNFTVFKNKNDPLGAILLDYSLNMDDYMDNALDLTEFFKKDPNLIKEFKRYIAVTGYSHITYFIKDIDNLTPEFFEHKSLYSFLVTAQVDENTKLFRWKDQYPDFLRYIGIDDVDIDKVNVTKYTFSMNDVSIEKIKLKDKKIVDLYNSIENIKD